MPFGIIDAPYDGKLPGTELLVDDEREDIIPEAEARQLKRIVYRGTDIILVPQPADHDPNDPVLWPRWKKEVAFWVIFFNTIVFAMMPGPMLAPQTFALSKTFNTSLTAIAELSGYHLLIVGAIGPLVSVLAQKYGKRPQFLFSAVSANIGTIICIVGSKKLDYEVLLAGRIVQGLGVTAWESLCIAAVGDLFFLHERGWRTALLVAALACSSSTVAVIAGVMSQNVGWQNLFVGALPLDIVCLFCTVFLLPETQYRRSGKSVDPAVIDVHDEKQARAGDDGNGSRHVEHAEVRSVPPKTYRQTLAVWTGVYTNKNIFHLLSEIFIHLLNPAVIWILLVSGVNMSFYVAAAYITAQLWSPPPYNLNVAQNGYFYSGALIGGLLAIFIGHICDWSARVMSKLNKGVFEAEFRIPINILAVLCCGLGWFLWMWDVEHPKPNGYVLASFCYGLVCYGISVPSTSAGLYILDSFPKQATEVFILQMMLKNFLFYGFSTFMNPWAAKMGAGDVLRVFGICSLALLATCIPMYVLGKLNRRFMHRIHQKNAIFRAWDRTTQVLTRLNGEVG